MALKKTVNVAALTLVLLLALAPARAAAATLTWIGATDTNWATAGNWDLNQAPQTGDDLVLTLSGSFRPENNNLAGVQLHSVTLAAAPNPLGFYLITGNAIVLQTGGSITSHHSAGFFDRVNVGVTLNGPATFLLAGTQLLTFNGPVTGTGGLTLVNNSGLDGQLQVRTVNTYTGSTTIGGNARTVAHVNGAIPGGSPVTIVSGGLTFNANSTIGSLAGTGVVAADGGGARTLTVGSNNTSTTSSGVLQDGPVTLGLTKIGSGTLTLSGANSYTGATTVNAGTLLMTGSLAPGSAATVANGGTLGGTGTVGGNVTAQLGARLAPGTSIGTLNVGGGVVWHGSATFTPTALFELSNSDATSDRLAITGALTKGSGSRFVFDFLGTGNEAVYTLATFASTTFSAANFSYTNLAAGLVGTFSIVGGNTLRFTVSEGPPSTHDFNSDLKADILWRDTSGGFVAAWLMNGAAIASTAIIANLATTWTAAGVGDFNGDGDADILWRETDGDLAVWLLNGTTIATNGPIFPVATSWIVAGLGDFNGDGNTDILWRNTSTGQVAIWLMNGTTPLSTAVIATVATTAEVLGVGDFDGDGRADILWRETTTGQVAIWLMNGTVIAATIPIATVATNWAVAGIGDFNGDGVADILWRETATGQVAIWLVNGTVPGTTSIASTHLVATVATTWTVALVQDFNADAHADILWRENDGTVAIWLMNGPTIVTSGLVAEVPTTWTPK